MPDRDRLTHGDLWFCRLFVLYMNYEQLPRGQGDFIEESCTQVGATN